MNLARFSFRTDAENLVDIEVSKDHQIRVLVDDKISIVLSKEDSKIFYESLRTSRELIHLDLQK